MRRLLAVLSLAALYACGGAAANDETPVAAVRHFLEVMDRSVVDERALQEAYRLLDRQAQAALTERAERASTLAGRRFEPWQMLAQGRFRLRFAPATPGGMRERVEGERAFVTVSGSREGQRAEVPLVREQGRWRIALPIPIMRPAPAPADPPREG